MIIRRTQIPLDGFSTSNTTKAVRKLTMHSCMQKDPRDYIFDSIKSDFANRAWKLDDA